MRKILQFILILLLSCQVAWAGYDCDGTDDFIDLNSYTGIPTDGEMSLYVVVSPDGTGTGQKILANWGSTYQDWLLDTSDSAGKIRFLKRRNTLTQWHGVPTTSNSYSAGDILRIAVAAQAETNSPTGVKLNMNGTETVAGTYVWYSSSSTDNQQLTFCAGNGGARTNYFNGKIYEVAVWDKLLTSDQLSLLVASRVKGFARQVEPANLKAYFLLNETSDGQSADGATLYDQTRNNNATANDGANNTGMTANAERILSYP